MSERVLNAEGRAYTITDRYGVVRSVERRGEKLVVNCGGSARSIETQDALVAAEDGNEWHISVGGSFSVQPGNKVRVIFAALDGGAPHAGSVKNVDTGASWQWSLGPLLPNFLWFLWTIAMLATVWLAIWSVAEESSRRLAPYAFMLGVVPILVGMMLRFLKRRQLTSMLRAEMEGLGKGTIV
jgi:hypothetical protein